MKKPSTKPQTAKQRQEDLHALLDAALAMKSRDELHRFLLDLCTPAEIAAFIERWKIACLLQEGELSYRDINDQTGASVTTIGRVARFLNQEPHQGYTLALQRCGIKQKG